MENYMKKFLLILGLMIASFNTYAMKLDRDKEFTGITLKNNLKVEERQDPINTKDRPVPEFLEFKVHFVYEKEGKQSESVVHLNWRKCNPDFVEKKKVIFSKQHLFEKAIAETNDSLRYELYRKADQVMMKDAPVVPLWYDVVVHLVQNNVSGFNPNALNLLELRRTKIKKS